MRLKSVQITNFKSIHDSGIFEIGDITCLVGKNEAGKTALLQALYRLNPIIDEQGKYDVDEDFPRNIVENYRIEIENKKRKSAIVVKGYYELDENEINNIKEEFGENSIPDRIFTYSKDYENKTYIYIKLDEQIIVKELIGKAALTPEINKLAQKATNLEELLAIIEPYKEDTSIEVFYSKIDELKSTGLVNHIFINYLKDHLPKFLYFDEYYQMTGSVNINKLKDRIQRNELLDSDRPILGLIKLARLDIDQLVNPQNTEHLISRIEGASNHLTNKILKYWSQNKYIEIRFDIRQGLPTDPSDLREGWNILGRVWNTKHKVSTMLGTRSKGFVWFFSFLAWFSTQDWGNQPIILLLDEPALFLHARAQSDMLYYMESELKPGHQVLYSTHSPFMIDPKRFDRVRIVEDKTMESDTQLPPEEEGTKVLTNILDTNPDSIFPLQGALGYDIYQTLFVGPNSLIVEGVSDLLYLQIISGYLSTLGRECLDPKWTITPVGGSEKVPTFVALIGAQKGLTIATLIDIKNDDTQKIEWLYKKKLLKKNHVLTFGDFTGSRESDIEDMFENDFYLNLVNSEYKNDLAKPILQTELNKKHSRIIIQIEEVLSQSPMKNGIQFSHYRPARFFLENSKQLEGVITPETLGRFESAFKTLNAILK